MNASPDGISAKQKTINWSKSARVQR